MSKKTHWKKLFNPDYIGAWALVNDEDMIVKIKNVEQKEISGDKGAKDEKMIITFENASLKPMICNATNAKQIVKLSGSDYIEEWIGLKIQLYSAKIFAFGENHLCLRIRDFHPKEEKAEKVKLDESQFQRMLKKVEAGQFEKSKALSDYELTNSQERLIKGVEVKTVA